MIQELDISDARAEEERMKIKGKGNSDAGPKIVAKRAPKNARKNDKKSNNAGATEAMGEMGAR